MVALRSLLLLTGVSLGAALPQTNSTDDSKNSIVSGAFIIEFDGEQAAETLYGELRSQHGLDIAPRLEMNFKLFNGASFTLQGGLSPETAIDTIASNPRVKSVWPVRSIAVPDDNVISVGQSNIAQVRRPTSSKRETGNFTYDPHVMTQVDQLHAAGYTGKGVKIGIVDSGVDYNHPDLGGCFGPGCIVSYGYDLIGGPYLGQGDGPDEDPMDECFGHGTHVAGIIAAQPNDMGFLGVAPDAEIGMYRAIDCMGMSTNDILIAAFNMAYEDGSDIITASLGMDGGWPDDAWSLAAQRIVEAGVPVLVAAGNSGETGLFNPSNPSSGRGVASVASVDTREYPFLLLAGAYEIAGEQSGQFGWIAGFPAIQNVSLPLYHLGSRTSSNGTQVDACSAIPDTVPSLEDFVVLVEEKPCSTYVQAENIAAKGGKYILFFGSTDEPSSANPMNDAILGVGTTTKSQATSWIKEIGGRNITVSLDSPDASSQIVSTSPNTVSPGYTSAFTSWGPNWDLSVNPTFAAPGARILSTFPLRLGSYSVEEGTSMACPFAAGVTALVAQARGTFDPETLRAVLSTTSAQLVFHDEAAADPNGGLAPVPQGGAGLIQGWNAANIKTIISTAVISFNDTDHLPSQVKFSVRNLDSEDTTYVLGNNPALTMYSFEEGSTRLMPFPNSIALDASAELEFAVPELSAPAGKSVEITVECTPPGIVDATRLPVYSGFLTLKASNGESVAVPYLGVAASMRDDTQIFYTSSPFGLFLGRFGDRWPMPLEANTVFSIPKPTNATDPLAPGNFGFPEARITTNIGSAALRVDVVALNGTAPQLPKSKWQGHDSLGQLPGFPRHHITFGGARGIFAGILANGAIVPEGRYQLVVSALRSLGNPEVESDWEVAELVPFVLQYLSE